ncbi:MAG TPA: DNA-processing protein DprA [Vicinamibacterales bacterium]
MDLQSSVALSILPGISRVRAAAVFKELRESSGIHALTLEEVIEACAPGAGAAAVAATALVEAAALVDAARIAGILPVCWDDERYPPLLRAIVDPPPVLWVRGDPTVLARPAVAIVGSRAATPYALEVAARLAGELAERQMLVISGLARGADGAAHRGCLAAGGKTVGVLGCGPDIIYPPEHRELAARLCRDGALVSELGPGAPPLPEHFPLRNRLISGISLAVVVVEANEKSGSLITARYALEHGRDVMAVPGSILGGRNRGSHALLKDGAKVVETADDILEELGWPALRRGNDGLDGPALRAGEAAGHKISSNPLKTDPLLANLTPGDAYDLDEMSATLGMAGSKLLPRLTEWEMRGLLVKLPGGRYALAAGRTS